VNFRIVAKRGRSSQANEGAEKSPVVAFGIKRRVPGAEKSPVAAFGIKRRASALRQVVAKKWGFSPGHFSSQAANRPFSTF
jgi:hypothetical protein